MQASNVPVTLIYVIDRVLNEAKAILNLLLIALSMGLFYVSIILNFPANLQIETPIPNVIGLY